AERTGPTGGATRGGHQPSPAERTGSARGFHQPPPAERTGPTGGATRGGHQPSPGERIGSGAGGPRGAHMSPPAERTGPTPGTARMPHQPPAERTGPTAGAARGMHQPPPAERTGPVPAVGHGAHPDRTGPMPAVGQVPLPRKTAQLPHHHQPGRPPRGTTGRGPLPGFPPRRRQGLRTGCLTALLVLVVVLVALVAMLTWLFRSPAAGADGPVQDGKLRFAVTSTKCPKPARAAVKRTCRVGVRVNNVGHEARVLYPGQQKLIDEDEKAHGGIQLIDKGGKEITPIRIEAGGAFTGALVFELPKNVAPIGLEVHDSGLSAGALVNLDEKP
ncbi:DUF4352 domain-containing protein, partial [Nonomuraea terrae]